MKSILFTIVLFFNFTAYSQEESDFVRTLLPPYFAAAWSITLGDDGFLYIFDYPATVVRIHPEIGEKEILHIYDDLYYPDERENQPICNHSKDGGHKGLVLHPNFSNPDSSYIFTMHTYNHGTDEEPDTRFKINRLKWNEATKSILEETTIVDGIPSGYEHTGGRMMATKENGNTYIYFTLGDLAPTETNCYENWEDDPRNTVQDPEYMNGKVHRILIDGSIPADNPIQGNSMWSRGHRNQQGLTHNPETGQIYSAEHGATTDDEVNVIEKGMNYGWYNVQGYHDFNREGEQEFIENYQPNPEIENDRLIEPLHSWCLEYTTDNWIKACTVAPSGMAYYNSDAMPDWKHSLLVVTLKESDIISRGIWRLKLSEDGKSILDSADGEPNPVLFFSDDQRSNGRLRDIAISKDGKSFYLINDGGAPDHDKKIVVYTYSPIGSVFETYENVIYPNPASDVINLGIENLERIEIADLSGTTVFSRDYPSTSLDISSLISGMYFAKMTFKGETKVYKFIKK